MPLQLTHDDVSRIIQDLLRPGNFVVGPEVSLTVEVAARDNVPWEIFRGRLVEPRFTRQTRSFLAHSVYLERETRNPLLTVNLDRSTGEIHITRWLHCFVWQADDAASNVVEGRENQRWLEELVGTLLLSEYPTADALRDELARRLFLAVVGTSRLPLHSVEAPLPGFTLGEVGYFCRKRGDESSRKLTYLEQTKLIELWLRAVPPTRVAEAAPQLLDAWKSVGKSATDLHGLLRNVLNEVSLSPYTTFVDSLLALARTILDADAEIDFLSFVLRQLARHLTAYDLQTFHYRGANYPDALLLDAFLKRYLSLVEECPASFAASKRRRRALRQACLLRCLYEGHPVPDAPTSPGENARVLPPPHRRVPEEQILNIARRRRRLYENEPTAALLSSASRDVFVQGLADLDDADELRELGTAVFIDRPLGRGKQPGEPDQTLLLAHETFSGEVARKRLGVLEKLLRGLGKQLTLPALPAELGDLGLPVSEVLPPDRPIVALADAARVAPDFRVVRTMPGSVREFLASFDLTELSRVHDVGFLQHRALIVPVGADEPAVAVFDSSYRKRIEMSVNRENGFRVCGRNEYPADGVTIKHVWDERGVETASDITLPPRPRSGFDM